MMSSVVTCSSAYGPRLAASLAAGSLSALTEAAVKPTLQRVVDHVPEPTLTALDRLVPGRDSPAWRLASDALIGLACVAPVVGGVALHAHGATGAFSGVLSVAEAVLWSNAVTDVVKFAVRRPRPHVVRPGATVLRTRRLVEQDLSFPSGHAAVVAASTAASATVLSLRCPGAATRLPAWGAAAVLTLLTSYGRVAGSMHYVSDVLGGSILGATVGYVLPVLQQRVGLAC